MEKNLTQLELGAMLGVCFQQVQKYETARSRVTANRLTQIAEVLRVPLTRLYGDDATTREVASILAMDSAFSLRLLRAYSQIKSRTVQRGCVLLMESIAANDTRNIHE